MGSMPVTFVGGFMAGLVLLNVVLLLVLVFNRIPKFENSLKQFSEKRPLPTQRTLDTEMQLISMEVRTH